MTLRALAANVLARLGLPPHSLRTRLMVWNMAILALLMGMLGLVTHTLVRSIMLTSVDREMLHRTGRFVRPRPPFPDDGPPPEPPPPFDETKGGPKPPPLPETTGVPKQTGPLRVAGGDLGPLVYGPRLPGSGHGRGYRGHLFGPPPPGLTAGTEGPGKGAEPPSARAALGGAGEAGRPEDAPTMVVLDRKGKVIMPPWEKAARDPQAYRRALRGATLFSNVVYNDRPMRVLTRPVPDHGMGEAVVQVTYSLTEVNRALAGLSRALLVLVPLALFFAAMGGAILTRRALAPVGRMAQAAGRIGAEDLSQRLPVTGKDEFGELGATFNGMLGRVEEAFRGQERLVEQLRRFTADASHELRTPLAIVKANAGLLRQGRLSKEDHQQSLEEIEHTADSMTRLVLDLLLLAHSDAGQLARDPVTLSIGEVLEGAAALVAHREGAAVHLRLPDPPLYVRGNEDELVRLVTNLLENALRYTPADGSVTLDAQRQEGWVAARVADTGVGIAPEDLPHLGERFYRVDASRSRPEGGSGLGLSICKSIAEAHGGRLEFESTVGKGTMVRVLLPAADDPLGPAARSGGAPTAPPPGR